MGGILFSRLPAKAMPPEFNQLACQKGPLAA